MTNEQPAAGTWGILGEVLAAFDIDQREWTLRALTPGLSGARIVRCDRVGGDGGGHPPLGATVEPRSRLVLKRWPAGTAALRVDQVHQVQQRAAEGLNFVPRLQQSPLGTTRVSYQRHHYELASWCDGVPLSDPPRRLLIPGAAPDALANSTTNSISDAIPRVIPVVDTAGTTASTAAGELATSAVAAAVSAEAADRLAAAAAGGRAIGRFHQAVSSLAETVAPPPAVLRRLGRIEQLLEYCQRPLPPAVTDDWSPAFQQAAQWWRREARTSLLKAQTQLAPWACQLMPLQLVIRDVHRQHVLFQDSVVTGLVDFDAVGMDSVAADLARWASDLSSGVADLTALTQAAIDGYQRSAPLSPQEEQLVLALAAASRAISLANWVAWVAFEDRSFATQQPLAGQRVHYLLQGQ